MSYACRFYQHRNLKQRYSNTHYSTLFRTTIYEILFGEQIAKHLANERNRRTIGRGPVKWWWTHKRKPTGAEKVMGSERKSPGEGSGYWPLGGKRWATAGTHWSKPRALGGGTTTQMVGGTRRREWAGAVFSTLAPATFSRNYTGSSSPRWRRLWLYSFLWIVFCFTGTVGACFLAQLPLNWKRYGIGGLLVLLL